MTQRNEPQKGKKDDRNSRWNAFWFCRRILSSMSVVWDGKPFWTMDSIMALKTISDPQISPDGSKVALRGSLAPTFQSKSYDSQIWVVSTLSGQTTSDRFKSSHVGR
jgi:hypothetical protein